MKTPEARTRKLSEILAILLLTASCQKKISPPENALRMALPNRLVGLDPIHADDDASEMILPNLYEGLLEPSRDTPKAFEPLLAEALPVISDGGRTIQFKLKSGIKFHDSSVFAGGKGREITSTDFIYSWKRVADPRNASENFWLVDGKIRGLNQWREKVRRGKADYDTPVEGLSAPDPRTLVLHLTEPFGRIEGLLARPFMAAVAREAVEKQGSDFAAHPVGTGPYRLDLWIPAGKLILLRNPEWHTAGANASRPEQLVFFEITEDQSSWRGFLQGALDLAEIPPVFFAQALNKDNTLTPRFAQKNLGVSIDVGSDFTYIGFNSADPLVGGNIFLRRALALAFDARAATAAVFGGTGETAEIPWKAPDLERAKELLKKAGYPGGKGLPPLRFSAADTAANRLLADVLAEQVWRIGVRLQYEFSPWPRFLASWSDPSAGKLQLFAMTRRADSVDKLNVFQLLYSRNAAPGPNRVNYHNPGFDALVEKASNLPDGPERTRLVRRMNEFLERDLPLIPIAYQHAYWAYQGWIQNLPKAAAFEGEFRRLWLDLRKKQQLQESLR